jgi:hypothetical protein
MGRAGAWYGRRVLAPLAVSIVAFGAAAGSAAASTQPAFSNGSSHMTKAALKRAEVKMAAGSPAVTPDVSVVTHGGLRECTAPVPGGGFENFFTTDTTIYREGGPTGIFVGECSANLGVAQVGATNDMPGGTVMIPFKGYRTFAEACDDRVGGVDHFGVAESIVYPDGEFVETCIAPRQQI